MSVRHGRFAALFTMLAGLVLVLGIGPNAAADPVLADPPATVRVSQRSTMAVLDWPAVANAAGYAVEIATDPSFTGARRVASAGTVTVLTGLTPLTSYSVRVASIDVHANIAGQFGTPLTFTTADREYALAAPVVTLRPDSTTAITAEWTKPAPGLRYQVRMDDGPLEGAPIAVVGGLSAAYTNLERRTKYYVSVRAIDAGANPVTAWSAVASVQTPEDVPLKVASFNIKCANCKQKSELAWPDRKAAVAATIRSQMPDVIGLQEASPSTLRGRSVSQYRDLLDTLGAPYKVTLTGGKGVDNRILYNSRTVQLVKTGVVALPKGGGRRFVVWAEFRQVGTGKRFFFADTHLSPGKNKSDLRVRQTRTLISTLKRFGSGLPTITVGDFNMFKWMGGNGYKPYSMMIASGYLDPLGNTYRSHSAAPTAFVENRIRTNFSTFNGFKRKAPAFGYDNGTQLDFIFVTKMRVSEWETVVNVDENRRFVGTIPSDHNMVRATVWLP